MIKNKIMTDKDLDLKVISLFIGLGLILTIFNMFSSDIGKLLNDQTNLLFYLDYLIICCCLGFISASIIAIIKNIMWSNKEIKSGLIINITNKYVTLSNKQKYEYQSRDIVTNGNFIEYKIHNKYIIILSTKK